MATNKYAVGIDLGTANTCTAVFRDGQVEIIPDGESRTMPSYVAFTESRRLVGTAAKAQAGANPENTVFNILRLLGRRYHDNELQADRRQLPFKVFNQGGWPVIDVTYRGVQMVLTPQDVLSMILAKVKQNAEAYLNSIVEDVLITVPAYFSHSQRQMVRGAALACGLNVIYPFNAATAAIACYTQTYNPAEEKNVFVLDLGAGTFDVALATVEAGIIEVKSVAGDNHLGGNDFDNRLVNYALDQFMDKAKIKQSERALWNVANKSAMRRLRIACEQSKRELSSRHQTVLRIDSFSQEMDLEITISRLKMEELCIDLFRNAFEPIERALRDAKIDKMAVHEVILVGGSYRIPRLRKYVSDFFNGKEPSQALNLDEAAASGAAIQCGILLGLECTHDFLLLDAVPFSLGIETYGGVMTALVKRNTTNPLRKDGTFRASRYRIPLEEDDTHYDEIVNIDKDKKGFLIPVFEGERARVKDNRLIGELRLPFAPTAMERLPVDVTFDVDGHFVLRVTASTEKWGRHKSHP